MQWTEKDYNKMNTAIKKGYTFYEDNPEKAVNYWWQVWNKINNYHMKNKSRRFYEALNTWAGWDTKPVSWLTDFEDAFIECEHGHLEQRIDYCEIMLQNYDDVDNVSLRILNTALPTAYMYKGDIKKADAFYKDLLKKPDSDLTVWVAYANTYINGIRNEKDHTKAIEVLEEAESRLKKRQVSPIGSNDLFNTMAKVYDALKMTEKADAASAKVQREEVPKESFFKRLFKK